MKTLMMLALAATISTTAVTQDRYFSDARRHRSVDLAPVAQRYIESLRTGNDGVMKSALAHATWMKLMVPEQHFTALQSEIAALSATASSPEVRYRAYLATLVFDRPAMFKGEEEKDFPFGDDLFTSIAQRASIALLEEGNVLYVRAQ